MASGGMVNMTSVTVEMIRSGQPPK